MKISEGKNQTSLLKTRRYLLFWGSSLLSNIGTWMQQVAQPWIMLTISHSSFLVGLDSFAMNAPGWVLTLWGGALADRLDRKKVILFFQSIQFLTIIALVFLLALKMLQPWMLILISLVVGTTDSLSMPSFQSIIPSLVRPDEIPQAISLNSIQFSLARTLGPAIAGIVMVQYGSLACFGANAVSFIPFFLSIIWIYPKPKLTRNFHETVPEKESLLSMTKAVIRQNGVRTQLLTTFVTTMFCSPIITFCTVLIKEVFTGQIKDFGNASTAFGLGGLIGALITYFLATKIKAKTPGLLGICMGIIILGMALNRSLFLLLIIMLIVGVLFTIANTATNSNLQMAASNQVRGRYASLYQLAFRGGLALGGLTTGLITSQFGIVPALLVNGTFAILINLCLLIF